MIEKMKKITLLVSVKERDPFLSALRKAGVVHVGQVSEPSVGDLPLIEKQITKVGTAITALSLYKESKAAEQVKPGEQELLERAGKISESFHDKERFEQEIMDLKHKLAWYDRWGEFEPEEIMALKKKGVNVVLYRLSRKQFDDVKDKGLLKEIYSEKRDVYAVGINLDAEEKLEYEEILLPLKGPGELKKESSYREQKLKDMDLFLKENIGAAEAFKELKDSLKKKREFLTVKFGMREEGIFTCLQGFCPAKYVPRVLGMAKDHGFGYLVEDPDDPEETPTLITNPRWIDIIRPVFSFMNTIPGYEEFDISFVFMVFFSLFFAMLIGDAGYGIIFAVITYLVRRKARKLPPQPFFLMYLLSGATIVWGAITGTWFGAERIAQLPLLNSLVINKISSFAGDNQNFMMFICFVIGAVHLTIAHLTRGIRLINSPVSLAQFGWISIIWGMFFTAGTLVIGRPFPHFAFYFLGAGILLVLVFANFQKNMFKGMLMTLAQLPLNVIGAFSDVVSYIRLFAVGYATVIVAQSFNDMAIGEGINSVLGGLVAALILFFGHTLNIMLGLMAVVVHGIRLNMLEFSSNHLGMQWTGRKYKPFSE